jgi:hypothetical protein
MGHSQAGGLTMQRVIVLAALSCLATIMPGQAQNQDSKSAPRTREIIIPSERTLERDAATSPKNEFSMDDATATRQMEQQNRRIDREVEKGICADC